MKKRVEIQVLSGCNHFGEGGTLVETIKRVPWFESMGNFNPMFCRYKGKRCLVKSKAGDISDPFRATEDYLQTLFIEIDKDKPVWQTY